MKILIVKVSALGDVVHALPVLDYLNQTVPGVEIDWIVEEGNRDVLVGNPLLRKVYTVRTRIWRKNPFSVETRSEIPLLRKELRARHYDIALDLQGNVKSGLITFLSGARERYGFDRGAVREWTNLLFTNHQVPLRSDDYHVSDRSLRVASVAAGSDYRGMTLSTDIHTSPDDAAVAESCMKEASGAKILFHPGTTWETKLWHEAGWVELGRQIKSSFPGATIFISWGNERERGVADSIASHNSDILVLPRLSVKSFSAILKKVDVVIGGDTGPIHMAAAVGTPTVSFYRVTDGKRNGPRGSHHILVQSTLECTACLRKECARDMQCRESISVNALLDGARKVLGT